VNESVKALTPAESLLYDNLDFDLQTLKEVTGLAPGSKLLHGGSTKEALMHMWRYPSLSIHGMEGAHAAPGAKTASPSHFNAILTLVR